MKNRIKIIDLKDIEAVIEEIIEYCKNCSDRGKDCPSEEEIRKGIIWCPLCPEYGENEALNLYTGEIIRRK